MLILSSAEICGSPEFNAKFHLSSFERMRVLEWIRYAPLPAAHRIFQRKEEAAAKRTMLQTDLTIVSETNRVLTELGSFQLAHFRNFQMDTGIHLISEYALLRCFGHQDPFLISNGHQEPTLDHLTAT